MWRDAPHPILAPLVAHRAADPRAALTFVKGKSKIKPVFLLGIGKRSDSHSKYTKFKLAKLSPNAQTQGHMRPQRYGRL